MKKMMMYLLATGISLSAMLPAHADDTGRHRHRTKAEKREARAERKQARAERREERREERRTGMAMNMNTGNTGNPGMTGNPGNPGTTGNNMNMPLNTYNNMPVTGYNTMLYPQAATPVTEDYVPSDVLSNLKNTYGTDLYDVTSMKCNNGGDCYTARIIKNGAVQTVVVNNTGNTVQ